MTNCHEDQLNCSTTIMQTKHSTLKADSFKRSTLKADSLKLLVPAWHLPIN